MVFTSWLQESLDKRSARKDRESRDRSEFEAYRARRLAAGPPMPIDALSDYGQFNTLLRKAEPLVRDARRIALKAGHECWADYLEVALKEIEYHADLTEEIWNEVVEEE